MNCKPGDLALIKTGRNANKLVLVKCVSAYGSPMWFVESMGGLLLSEFGGVRSYQLCGNTTDSNLRPIRDQPGEDETLQWAPVPTTYVTPA